jgi:hypothetical protein
MLQSDLSQRIGATRILYDFRRFACRNSAVGIRVRTHSKASQRRFEAETLLEFLEKAFFELLALFLMIRFCCWMSKAGFRFSIAFRRVLFCSASIVLYQGSYPLISRQLD